MKVGTIIRIISVSFAIIAVSFVILIISNNKERAATSTQAEFKQLGLDLSDASDFLTNQARSYVQYGEKKYYDAYMTEVEVTKTRETVVAELKRLGAPQNELDLVQKAATLSDTLAALESRAFEAVANGDMETARELVFGADYENGKTPIVNTMQQFQNAMAERTNSAAERAKTNSQIALIAFSVLFVAVAVVIIASLVSIRKKINLVAVLADCATKMAEGSTNFVIDTASNDEVGVLADAFRKMVDSIQKQVAIAEHIANGNLTVEALPRSKEDTMGIALEKMVRNLNKMFSQINNATLQVSAGAKQIAQSSQSLSQGTTEQSASVEQLLSTVCEVESKTKDNAELAVKAAALADTIKVSAEKGSDQMRQMVEAVNEINNASQSINKIIKVIDDIAFQTNILALNAAVEAARAGQHGKGFSVVAEEVRSLAAKSADAAKDTNSLIENSIEKTNLGVRIANDTAVSLDEIVSGINKSSKIVGDIAVSSKYQSIAIAQINEGINMVSQVVQQNSSMAEESAETSDKMSNQADLLEELVIQFKLKDSVNRSYYIDDPSPVLRIGS